MRTTLLALLSASTLALCGCGPCGGAPDAPTPAVAARKGIKAKQGKQGKRRVGRKGKLGKAAAKGKRPPGARPGVGGAFPRMKRQINAKPKVAGDQHGAVILVVLDAVRADHTSLCGYERPTTPYLSSLGERGAVHTCHAYAPGTWTLPSHASFFTGLPTWEHHVMHKGRALSEEVQTLAEVYAERGYQTVLVSGNPTLAQGSGLWQGFDIVRTSPGFYAAWRGPTLHGVIKETLAGLSGTRPLFLVVNVFDAHDPYPAVPPGEAWVPQRESVDINPRTPDGVYRPFVEGELQGEARARLLATLADTYDWGVRQADRALERLFRLLEDRGWLSHGVRMVITSDHGEHLGEHGLIRHDGPPWEAVARIPLIYLDDRREAPIELPEPLAASHVFELLRDGTLPDPARPPTSASIRYHRERADRVDALALWPSSTDKLMWLDGRELRFDLARDRGETEPKPLGRHPSVRVFREAVTGHRASKAANFTPAPDVVEQLKQVGYLE